MSMFRRSPVISIGSIVFARIAVVAHRFCPTCSPSVAIYVLQTTIAGNLLWPPNWHELGPPCLWPMGRLLVMSKVYRT